MPIETERKFLVENDGWKRLQLVKKIDIQQGYLPSINNTTLRIRISNDCEAFLTVKIEMPGRGSKLSRYEFEQSIPLEEAKQLFKMCENTLEKTRHILLDNNSQILEVDIFKKHLRGLKLIEIELPDEKKDVVRHPWFGEEVTDDASYSNAALARASAPPTK